MKSLKWAVVLAVVAAMGFAGGVFAAGAKKEMTVTKPEDMKFAPLDPKDTEGKGPQMAVVFGDPKKKGAPLGIIMKFPAGFTPGPHTHSSDDYAVVIQGVLHNFSGTDQGPAIGPGGTWYQPAKQVHDNKCEEGGSGCMAFVYTPTGFDFQPAKGAAPMGEKGADKKDMGKPEKAADKPADKK
ncbi:MAG TPA: DUF4437 domain-containing protein [Myxococcaceae bacterium]|nr:DUF4437 domain-containing protein [Myxococcaceae bacterium]